MKDEDFPKYAAIFKPNETEAYELTANKLTMQFYLDIGFIIQPLEPKGKPIDNSSEE